MLNILKRIFRASPNNQNDQPMIQWAPEHLAEVKKYFETKPPEALERGDWYLVVEWIAQRYFPDDCRRMEAEWRAILNEIRKKIDDGIDNPVEALVGTPLLQPGVIEDAGDPEFTQWMNDILNKK